MPSDYIVLMRRRLPALLTCFLVLTSSISWTNVCEGMGWQAKPQDTLHTASSIHGHDSPPSSHSHRTSDKSTPLNHCQNATSCTWVVLATDMLLPVVCSPADGVMQMAALVPDGNSPDLEPPPPKA